MSASNQTQMTSSPISQAAPAVQTDNVCRHYPMGGGVIRAVDGISLTSSVANLWRCSANRDQEVYPAEFACRSRPPQLRLGDRAGSRLGQVSSEELAGYRRNDVGMVFQAFHLIPR